MALVAAASAEISNFFATGRSNHADTIARLNFWDALESLPNMSTEEIPTRQGQVQVHFITNSPDIELPEEKRQLLVPTGNAEPHLPAAAANTDWSTI